MNKISAKIIADSKDNRGNRITSYILTYPRIIHAEVMTHRMFSRNAASSRAIPFNKMVEMVQTDPFIPIAWQEDHKGMQGTKYITESHRVSFNKMMWIDSANDAIKRSINLSENNITKQLCNRLLEPFLWYTCLVTATEYENFFSLRCPKYHTLVSGEGFYHRSRKEVYENHSNPINLEILDNLTEEGWWMLSESGAEIHIQALAEAMWDAQNESTPKLLKDGEWHIPFGEKLNKKEIDKFAWITNKERNLSPTQTETAIAVARCARLSYMTFDKEIDFLKDVNLHDQLLESGHMSPFEHVCRVMSDDEYFEFAKGRMLVKDGYGDGDSLEQDIDNDTEGWCNNIRGFIQYRYLIENKNTDV